MDINQIGEFLEQVANLSQSVYWLSNADLSQIVYVSPAYERIWQRSRKILYNNPEQWITYLHPDDVKNHHPIHTFAEEIKIHGQAARYNQQYRIIRPNGEIRYILDRGFPIYMDGVCCGVTGFATDITDNKLAEDELKKIKYQLEGAKLISSSIAHEIRTPLATIKSNLFGISDTIYKLVAMYETGLKGYLDVQGIIPQDITELSKALKLIDVKVDQSNIILNMLLTKLQDVNFEFTNFTSCSANNCIINALETFALPKDMAHRIHFFQQQDFIFWGNDILVIHVLMNLLKNAVFYINKANKGEITIWLEQQEVSNEIHFKDTALGISQHTLSKIFNLFFTTEPSTGTGIGLAFSKMVMQSHQGEINCQSEEGQYTEFILSFPNFIH